MLLKALRTAGLDRKSTRCIAQGPQQMTPIDPSDQLHEAFEVCG